MNKVKIILLLLVAGCGGLVEINPDVNVKLPGLVTVGDQADTLLAQAVYADDDSADTWALGIIFNEGCIQAADIDFIEITLRVPDDDGIYRRYWRLRGDNILMYVQPFESICISGVSVWPGLNPPCDGMSWCGEAEIILDVLIVSNNDEYRQFLIELGMLPF